MNDTDSLLFVVLHSCGGEGGEVGGSGSSAPVSRRAVVSRASSSSAEGPGPRPNPLSSRPTTPHRTPPHHTPPRDVSGRHFVSSTAPPHLPLHPRFVRLTHSLMIDTFLL
ncbi:uncharacterized protein LOC143912550 [Arctopsyche grandis]|uniref:uncharacterized protein LOC143912550 n=1 Tax=Arctopsyche grandis TaxID=121162 RepID=UPI00406D6837